MGFASEDLYEGFEDEGWDEDMKLELLADFVQENGMARSFKKYLERRASSNDPIETEEDE